MSQMPLIPEIDNILVSTDYELDQLIRHVRSDTEKITDQYIEGVVSALERREKLLESCLEKVVVQEKGYKLPQDLVDHILDEILKLQARPLRSRIESSGTQQRAFFSLLERIDKTLRNERYRIKIDKTESGPNT